MAGEPQPDNPRQAFEFLLNRAITAGHRPTQASSLGPRTWSAVDVVACAHPEAAAVQISDAYDAFHAEHGDHG